MANIRCLSCGKPVTRREKKKNSGLCDRCFAKVADRIAAELDKKQGK